MSSIGTGYDLSSTSYSPDGRVFQVEYAAKAVENSGYVRTSRQGHTRTGGGEKKQNQRERAPHGSSAAELWGGGVANVIERGGGRGRGGAGAACTGRA